MNMSAFLHCTKLATDLYPLSLAVLSKRSQALFRDLPTSIHRKAAFVQSSAEELGRMEQLLVNERREVLIAVDASEGRRMKAYQHGMCSFNYRYNPDIHVWSGH